MTIAGRTAIVLALSSIAFSLGASTSASAYVAIWYDAPNGIYGITSASEPDRPAANRAAGMDCYNHGGGPACTEVVYSKVGCVALAVNGNRWGSGSGATLERARQKALDRAGGGKVLAHTCDFW